MGGHFCLLVSCLVVIIFTSAPLEATRQLHFKSDEFARGEPIEYISIDYHDPIPSPLTPHPPPSLLEPPPTHGGHSFVNHDKPRDALHPHIGQRDMPPSHEIR
uniref:Uncharacterized protein n=1 Tax=Avena sativa TaxID=4498 RepID=A0ACD5T895_AVESA